SSPTTKVCRWLSGSRGARLAALAATGRVQTDYPRFRPCDGHRAPGRQRADHQRLQVRTGPCLLGLEVSGDTIKVSVWDTDPALPAACPSGPGRVGQHGLETTWPCARASEVRREPV